MKAALALASLVALAALSAASAPQFAAARAETGGMIVFTSDRGGSSHIYAVNADGTGLTQLTNTSTGEYSPIPSPDGRLIAFSSDDRRSLMNADGSGARPLVGCQTLRAGAWSPDSGRLVCEAGEDAGLAVAEAATGVVTRLTRAGRYASWSPDGRTIAFIDGERLWSVPASGGVRRRIGNRKIDEEAMPSWSPDSQRLAYIGSAGANFREDLFTIRADGSGERRLVQRVFDNFQAPQWSPEGSLIAFTKGLPHFVAAVYTVRTDGTGLRRISVSPGGESSSEPSWSADGATLVYIRSRYRDAEATDVFVTTSRGRGGRAVTRPFPVGGSNEDALWMTGTPLTGVEPAPRKITLPLVRKLSFAAPLESLVTDGRLAIPNVHADSNSSGTGVLVWDAIARRTLRMPRLCDGMYLGNLALAGRRLAWTCSETGNTFVGMELRTLLLGARRPTRVTETIADNEGVGETIGSLVGHGSTIAFTTYHGTKKRPKAWLLLPRHAGKCPNNSDLYGVRLHAVCRLLARAAGGVTTSVDAGRVLTVAPNGLVRLVSTRGRVLRTWTLARGVVNARIRGRNLAVQHGVFLDVYDANTGAKRQTLPLASEEGLPFLLDVQGDLVAYATGGAIHLLRLSDGRDVALDLPGAAPRLDARLERAGLFVMWNQMYNRRPGRMAFVPMRTVIQRFDSDSRSR